jgi:hypothetical protein
MLSAVAATVIPSPPMRAYVSITALPLLLACGGESSPAVDAAPPDASAVCIEAENHSDLAWLQENVFTPSCSAFTACHKGTAQEAGGLNLEAGQFRNSMVNVPSDLFPDYQMIVPGDPAASYLMVILGHVDGPIDPDVGTMPYNNPLLCTEVRDAVARWIEAGALE